MPLHQAIQKLILLGVPLQSAPEPPLAAPPAALEDLIGALRPSRKQFDERAIRFGHRYRSGFWSIYVLSAFAVLCAVMPLALGWDSPAHSQHRLSGVWAVVEVGVIALVSAIYWRGHKSDWQGEWLRARTTAELTNYLPLIAPLLISSPGEGETNWYRRIFDPGQHPNQIDDISALCSRHEAEAQRLGVVAWLDPRFPSDYARWVIGILDGQRHYHRRVAARQHALLHRTHRITTVLFALTAVGALTHLLVHTLWLSLVTTFFPALAASLHGAVAQSESYRLQATSHRLEEELGHSIEQIEAALKVDEASIKQELSAAIEAAMALLLEEHQDWQMLVRPHHLPLA